MFDKDNQYEQKDRLIEDLVKQELNREFNEERILKPALKAMDSRAKAKTAFIKKGKEEYYSLRKRRMFSFFASGFAAVLLILALSNVIYNIINFSRDHIMTAFARNKVINSQYLPDSRFLSGEIGGLLSDDDSAKGNINKTGLTEKGDSVLTAASDILTVPADELGGAMPQYSKDIDKAGYDLLIEQFGAINTGRIGNRNPEFTSVLTVKDEIYRILSFIPQFNKWYTDSTEGGNEYSYYIEYDSKADMLSISRMSHYTRVTYYDPLRQKESEQGPDGKMCTQLQIIQVKYYYDEDDNEVMDFNAFSYIVYNGGHVPMMYQRLINVKDKSLTKVVITAGEDLRQYLHNAEGVDVSQTTPYGAKRSFIQMDYTDSQNVSLLFVDQWLPMSLECYPWHGTWLRYYGKKGEDVNYYETWYDYLDMSEEHNSMLDFSKVIRPFSLPESSLAERFAEYRPPNKTNSTSYMTGRYGNTETDEVKRRYSMIYSVSDSGGYILWPYSHDSQIELYYYITANMNMFSGFENVKITNLNFEEAYRTVFLDDKRLDMTESPLSVYLPEEYKLTANTGVLDDNSIIVGSEAFFRLEDLLKLYEITNYPLSDYGKMVLDNSFGVAKDIGYALSKLGENLSVQEAAEAACFIPQVISLVSGKYELENIIDAVLELIAKDVVDSFALKNNIESIMEARQKSVRITKYGNVSAVSEIIKLDSAWGGASLEGELLSYSLKGAVKPTILLKPGNEYCLGLIMYDERNSFIVDAQAPEKYSRSEMLFNTSAEFHLKDLSVTISGTYNFGYALVSSYGGRLYLCSDIAPVEVTVKTPLNEITFEKDGFSVTAKSTGTKIEVQSTDIEKPVITPPEGFNGSVDLKEGDYAYKILDGFGLSDNDKVAKIEISHSIFGMYGLYSKVKAGRHTVYVYDRTGNVATLELTVEIIP